MSFAKIADDLRMELQRMDNDTKNSRPVTKNVGIIY